MDAGERDRQVTLQQVTEGTTDSDGFPLEPWSTLASVFAKRIDLGGSEMFKASQLSAPYDTRWEIAYRTDMDPDELDIPKVRRLVYKGRPYDIVAASEIGRREGIELFTLSGGLLT
jgi:SPP1 family predicted phage head-tail adaptor